MATGTYRAVGVCRRRCPSYRRIATATPYQGDNLQHAGVHRAVTVGETWAGHAGRWWLRLVRVHFVTSAASTPSRMVRRSPFAYSTAGLNPAAIALVVLVPFVPAG